MLVVLVFLIPILHGGETGIDPQPVNIVLLLPVLHLHDESFAVLVFAVEVVTDKLVLFPYAEHFRRQVGNIGDDSCVIGDEYVQKVHQYVLVAL